MEAEHSQLLPGSAVGGDASPAPLAAPRRRRTAALVVLGVVAISAVAAYSGRLRQTNPHSQSGGKAASSLASSRSSKELHVTFGNEYGKEDGWRAYPFLKDAHLVEPHRQTTVSVKAGTGLKAGQQIQSCTVVVEAATRDRPESSYDAISGVEGLATYRSTVQLAQSDDGGGSDETTFTGVVHFPQPSTFSATVTCEVDEDERSVVSVAQRETVECLYVRRELRRMTDLDRNDWFDALAELYKISQTEAQQRYGPAASSMHQLIAAHLDLVIYDMRLDHLHGGLGFLTHHTALSARAEFAMQAINPRLSMPYWDFTIDSQMVQKNSVKTLADSVVFSEDWFGVLDTDAHTVTKGRWAYLEVPKHESQDETPGNAFGVLRGPWNLNPSPYVTRFHGSCGSPHSFSMPSCGAHLQLVENYDEWRYVGDLIKQNAVHDGAHLYTGGVGGECTEVKERVMELVGYNVTRALTQIMPATMQWMYRAHLQKPPDSCVAGEPCAFTCSKNVTAATILVTELFNHFGYSDEVTAWEKNPNKEEAFKAFFCDTKAVLGDAIDAGGANDPTFWPIHPPLERLYQYKDLVKPLKVRHWPTGGEKNGEKDGASTTDDDYIPCYSMWYSSKCESHHAFDKVAFEANMRNDDGNYVPSVPTNHMFLHAMTPGGGNYRMSYVYENFIWEHCELDGFVFPKVQ